MQDKDLVQIFMSSLKTATIQMAFCDEIQHEIKEHLDTNTRFKVISQKMDLSPSGSFLSTKKFLTLKDTSAGKEYKVTIEESK